MGSAGRKRSGRKRLPKARGNPGRLTDAPTGGNPLGVWYGATAWPHGDGMQRDQAVPVKILGAVVLLAVLVVVVIALVAN